jgi:hypothetical protein
MEITQWGRVGAKIAAAFHLKTIAAAQIGGFTLPGFLQTRFVH